MKIDLKVGFLIPKKGSSGYFRLHLPGLALSNFCNTFLLNESNLLYYDLDLIYYNTSGIEIIDKYRDKIKAKLILDQDDIPKPNKDNPHEKIYSQLGYAEKVIKHIKNADAITTTSEYLASKIRPFNNNVGVFPNAVDPIIDDQFTNRWKPGKRVRILYAPGATHTEDTKILRGVFNRLQRDKETKDKFTIQLAGFNLQKAKRVYQKDTAGNLLGYRDEKPNILKSIPIKYEKILTHDYEILPKDYAIELRQYKPGDTKNDLYQRIWVKDTSSYAYLFDNADIILAPLQSNEFNRCKSNLKMVEAATRKLPIICSNTLPYNEIGTHYDNCILSGVNGWFEYIKELILDADLRKELGENLAEDIQREQSLYKVTLDRLEFLKKNIFHYA
jgi:hypothetical protein